MTHSALPKADHKISPRNWFVLAALALTGQIAWSVENMWFGTFVYQTITPHPGAVAWMVWVSAIIATLTTLVMGTLSDRTRTRWGRRKPYILIGYILWGISTVLFPTVAYIKITSLAVLMVVLADAVMTFFGSTANDAAFNAWTADIAASRERGRVEGVLNLSLYIAYALVLGAAGALIDQVGYFIFFYALGGLVIVIGFLGGSLLQETLPEEKAIQRPPVWRELLDLFNLQVVRHNRTLFILLLYIMLAEIATQITFSYLIIYLTTYIGMSNTEFGIVGGAVMVGSALVAVPFGILADRWDRRKMIVAARVLSAASVLVFSYLTVTGSLALTGFLWKGFAVAAVVASTAWLKDILPEEQRGKFLGVRMVFWILVPMLLGTAIGSVLIQTYGNPILEAGLVVGYEPHPIIFRVEAVLTLLALIPIFFIKKADALRQPAGEAEAPIS